MPLLTSKPIRSLFNKTKSENTDISDCQGVVYNIPCGSCDKSYVGNTGRKFSQRGKDHQYAIKCHNLNNSISLHRHQEGHLPALHKATVLHFESKIRPRYNLENLEILARQNSLINHLIPDNTPMHEWSALIHNVSNRANRVKSVVQERKLQNTQTIIPNQVEGATMQSEAEQRMPGSGSGVMNVKDGKQAAEAS